MALRASGIFLPCGVGDRSKKVVCLKDLQVVDSSKCGSDTIIYSQEECNKQPCSEDTIIPTDVTKSVDESETKEMATTVAEKEDTEDADYEIIESDEGDDGVWVDTEGVSMEPLKEATKPGVTVGEDKLGSSASTWSKKSSLSMDDLMLSDAPSSPEESQGTEITGSRDEELTSVASTEPSTISEGSGDTEPWSTFETDVPIEAESVSELESQPTGGETEATLSGSDGTESSKRESSEQSTELSTEAGVTESSEGSTSSEGATEVSSSGGSDLTTEPESTSSDLATESSSDSGASEVSSESSTSSDLEQTTESTEGSETTESSDTSETTENTETTSESSSSTESSDSTGDAEVSTTESSQSSESRESSTDGSASTDLSGTTQEGGTTEAGGSTEVTSVGGSFTEAGDTFIGESDPGFERETTKASTMEEASGTTTEDASGATTQAGASSMETEAGVTSESTTEQVTEGTKETSESSGNTEAPGASTEKSGATETTTEFMGSTESAEPEMTEGTVSTEFDSRSSTTENGTTEESWETTPLIDVFQTQKPKTCKRKKQKSCKDTLHCCCWDQITPAEGPFDKGCPNLKTCDESKFGCCEDGVSPALEPKSKGCPSTHCNETLFGCCWDNKTIAEGNDQEGCPPPPPECTKSKYGCCKGCEKEPQTFANVLRAWCIIPGFSGFFVCLQSGISL